MNAGKNRKRDLELLSEVYSEGLSKYYDAQATGCVFNTIRNVAAMLKG